jgi:hypothetical protein
MEYNKMKMTPIASQDQKSPDDKSRRSHCSKCGGRNNGANLMVAGAVALSLNRHGVKSKVSANITIAAIERILCLTFIIIAARLT